MAEKREKENRTARRMTRPRRGGILAGVCAGISNHLQVSAGVVRVLFVFLALAHGLGFILYAAAWILMPRDAAAKPAEPVTTARPEKRIRPSVWVGFLMAGLGAVMLNHWLADRFDWFHAYRDFWNRLHFMSWELLIPLLFIATGAALVFRATKSQAGGKESPVSAPKEIGPARNFRRVETGKVIAGVCAGLAHETGIDPLWPRLAFAALCLITHPLLGFLLYAALVFVMEKPVAAQTRTGRNA